jgi:Fe-S cluster assembly iron-binding protein IscA
MLQCTPAAVATLQQVREQNSIPETFGVRLFAARSPEGGVGLGIGFVEQPAEGDEITQQHGSTLIVAREVSDELSELTLDVIPDPSNNGQEGPQLVLRPSSET